MARSPKKKANMSSAVITRPYVNELGLQQLVSKTQNASLDKIQDAIIKVLHDQTTAEQPQANNCISSSKQIEKKDKKFHFISVLDTSTDDPLTLETLPNALKDRN